MTDLESKSPIDSPGNKFESKNLRKAKWNSVS